MLLMEEYAQETIDTLGEYISVDSVNGRIYGLPLYRYYAANGYVIMRKDVLNDLGLLEKAEEATTWTEIGEIFGAVEENTDLNPLGTNLEIRESIYGDDTIMNFVQYDGLGDSFLLVCTDDQGNVTNMLDNEVYKLHSWLKNWNRHN